MIRHCHTRDSHSQIRSPEPCSALALGPSRFERAPFDDISTLISCHAEVDGDYWVFERAGPFILDGKDNRWMGAGRALPTMPAVPATLTTHMRPHTLGAGSRRRLLYPLLHCPGSLTVLSALPGVLARWSCCVRQIGVGRASVPRQPSASRRPTLSCRCSLLSTSMASS